MNPIFTIRRNISLFVIIALALLFNVSTLRADSTEQENIRSALVSLGVESISQEVVSTLSALWPDSEQIQTLTASELENQLELSIRTWQMVAPEWRDIPASLMIQIRECRDEQQNIQQSTSTTSTTTTTTTTNKCDEHLRLQLRFQHAERLTNRFTERTAEAEALPEPSRTFALQTLATLRERVQTRLQEMLRLSQDSIDNALRPIGENQESLNQVRTRLEQQMREMDQTQQSTPTTSTPRTNDTTNNQQGSKP